MDRIERLMGLIAGLAQAGREVPFSEIKEWFPEDYARPSAEAAERKFERDKKDLIEMGVPLTWRDPDEDSDGGYRIDARKLYLPELRLTPDEMATVYLSGLALVDRPGFPFRDALALALRKIEIADGTGATPRARLELSPLPAAMDQGTAERIEALGAALTARKRVRFQYESALTAETSAPEVEPYGLFCRRGEWLLVGRSLSRNAIRSYFVSRMSALVANARQPANPDFEVPADFDVRAYADVAPWRYAVHEPIRVEIAADPGHAWRFARALDVREEPPPGAGHLPDWPRLHVETTNAAALSAWAAGQGARVVVMAPPAIRERTRLLLAGIAAKHLTART